MKQLVISTLFATGLVITASAVESATPQKGFKTSFAAGLTLTDGNSETMQANASLTTEGEKEGLGSVRAGAEAKYGQSTVDGEEDTTVNSAKGFANAKKTLTPLTFWDLDGSVLHDEIADIGYRATFGPGVGVYLMKTVQTALSVEAGPTYVWEEVAGVRDDYLAARFAERLDQVISPTAKLWEGVEYLPRVEDFSDYILTAEVGVEAAMTTRVNLRLVLQDKYDSTPGAGLEENDLSVIGALAVSL